MRLFGEMNKDNLFYIQVCTYSFVEEFIITYEEYIMCTKNPKLIRIIGLKKFFENEKNEELPLEYFNDIWFVLCLEESK